MKEVGTVKTCKYRIIIRNIHPDGAAVHDVVRQELGKVEIVNWRKEGEVNFQGDRGSGPQRHVYVVVEYRDLPKKTKKKVAGGKRPAHEVVVGMVKEVIGVFAFEGIADREVLGRLDVATRMLKSMIIPKEHIQRVVEELRQVKKEAHEKGAVEVDILLPESLFTDIEF
jgi:hypothetical protein